MRYFSIPQKQVYKHRCEVVVNEEEAKEANEKRLEGVPEIKAGRCWQNALWVWVEPLEGGDAKYEYFCTKHLQVKRGIEAYTYT